MKIKSLVVSMLRKLDIDALREDLRKISTGVITAALIALYIPGKPVTDIELVMIVVLASILWLIGLKKS